jgi:hypothetical protein
VWKGWVGEVDWVVREVWRVDSQDCDGGHEVSWGSWGVVKRGCVCAYREGVEGEELVLGEARGEGDWDVVGWVLKGGHFEG